MNDAHFYVEIRGKSIFFYIFEEDSSEVKYFQAMYLEEKARFFVLVSSQYKECPTFISMVDERFPHWVPGMPLNATVKGLPLHNWKQQTQPVFDFVLYT